MPFRLPVRLLVQQSALRRPIPQRSFRTTSLRSATLAAQPHTQPTILRFSPSSQYIEQEELDVELPAPEDVKLVITDRAAEVTGHQFTIHSVILTRRVS